MTMDNDILDTIGYGSRVQQFYAGQSVFVTGGTGFLGKLLIEKLLRTCRDLKMLYVLIRPKKGEEPSVRLNKLFEDCVYDRLRKQVPNYRKKVQLISGDCTMSNLGLSDSDVKTLLQQTTIVFNVAATVKFNETLKQALVCNVKSIDELLKLCSSMPNLKAVMHVSTAYSNCVHQEIGERFYSPSITVEDSLELLKRSDNELTNFENSVLNKFPNTYVYTKCIAENVVRVYGKTLPVAIFRPAIVLSTYKEPIPGWLDNLQGPTTIVSAIYSGFLRTFNMDQNQVVEMVPADYSVNLLITAAWEEATAGRTGNEPKIYNYGSTHCGSKITWGNFLYFTGSTGKSDHKSKGCWYNKFTFSKCHYFVYILQLILHILPALLIDTVMQLIFGEPKLLKHYKKLHKYGYYVKFFTMHGWDLGCDNTMKLWRRLGDGDRILFPFSMESFDWHDFINKYSNGIDTYMHKNFDMYRYKGTLTFTQNIIRYGIMLTLLYSIYIVIHHVLSTWITGLGV